MKRATEKDDYGGVIEYSLPEIKRCPICRKVVQDEEINILEKQFTMHPEVDDGGYVI